MLTRRIENFTALPDNDKPHPDAAAGSTRDPEARPEPSRKDAAPGDARPLHSELRPSNDDLLDYRARAAACRAKAEKAGGEHQGEASTWLQVAAMWDGLADRLENKAGADTVSPAAPAAEEPQATDTAPTTAPMSEVAAAARENEAEPASPPASPPLGVAPQPAAVRLAPQAEAAPRSRGLRLAGIAAGLLVLVAVPVLWWRTGERAGPQRQAAPQAPPAIIEAPPNPAKERPSQPAEAAPAPVMPASVVPSAAPSPAVPPAPAPPAPVAATSETGPGPEPAPASASPAEGAAPDAGDAASLPSAQPAPAAPPSEPRPDVPAQLGPILGTWWADACPKPAERKAAVPMVLGEDRARAGTASCAFQRKTQAAGAAGAWTIVARCSDGGSSWTAHIRLALAGKRLNWSSERGTQTYVRCP